MAENAAGTPKVMSVPLSQIVPSEGNPRSDFGRIDELAESIEATGGQPLQPLVVVRDGLLFRIVDGERRFRAMSKLHDADFAANVLVYEDFGDALQAVAMVASDDKKRLDDAERARGFQSMLTLGVDEVRVAKALHRSRKDVRLARGVASLEEASQATLDQMICAAQFDGADRMAVLKAAPDKWATKAESIRRRRAQEAKVAELMDAFALAGIEVLDERPEGYAHVIYVSEPGTVARCADDNAGERLAAWPCGWSPGTFDVGREDGEQEDPAETAEERERRETQERISAACAELASELIYEISSSDIMPHVQEAGGAHLRVDFDFLAWNEGRVREHIADAYERHLAGTTVEMSEDEREDVAERHFRDIATSPWSMYEAIDYLRNPGDWSYWVSVLLPAAMEDDYCPSEEDLWLLERAREEVARTTLGAEDGAE